MLNESIIGVCNTTIIEFNYLKSINMENCKDQRKVK